MDNYEAISYACVALSQLQKEGKEVNENTLKGRMLYLMDMKTPGEIYKIFSNGNS